MVTAAMKLKMLAPWKERYDKPRQCTKKQRYHFSDEGSCSQNYGFSSSDVWMWELDHKEDWLPKNHCVWIMVLEKTLIVHWISRRSSQSILKEINCEHSLEGLMLKLKLQYFGRLKWRVDSLEKNLMLGKIEQEEKGMAEDEMVGWHHWLNRHEFEQILGDSEGQGSLACCSP